VRLRGVPGERVEIFDVRARRVAALVLSGAGDATWDGRDRSGRVAAPGVYLVRASGRSDTRLAWLPRRR